MALKDSVITLVGAQASVRKIEIIQNANGDYVVGVYGDTKTSLGKAVGLDLGTETAPAGTAVLDAIWAHCLPVLRKANGLE